MQKKMISQVESKYAADKKTRHYTNFKNYVIIHLCKFILVFTSVYHKKIRWC